METSNIVPKFRSAKDFRVFVLKIRGEEVISYTVENLFSIEESSSGEFVGIGLKT